MARPFFSRHRWRGFVTARPGWESSKKLPNKFMAQQFPELPGWSFYVKEISAGVFKAFGNDGLGRNVEFTGVDPDAILESCKVSAIQIMAKLEKQDDK